MSAIQENSTYIEQVFRTSRSEIDGYPVALVIPSENQADYNHTGPTSNKETYVFTVRIIYPFTEGQETADLRLEEALDELLDLFRDRTVLGSVVDWVKPVPSVWGYQDNGMGGVFRIADMKIEAVKYNQ